MPARKNGDRRFTHYKGCELIPPGMSLFLENLKPKERSKILIIYTYHSNSKIEYDKNDFSRDLESILKRFPEITLNKISILKPRQLWGLFKDKRTIVLDQFGVYHGILAGIAKEALALGCPVITGSCGKNDYLVLKAFNGQSPPIEEAHDSQEIADRLLELFKKDKESIETEFKRRIDYSHCYANTKKCFKGVLDTIENSR